MRALRTTLVLLAASLCAANAAAEEADPKPARLADRVLARR